MYNACISDRERMRMTKGKRVSKETRKKISETKLKRVERTKVAIKIVMLILKGNTQEAEVMAKENLDKFMLVK